MATELRYERWFLALSVPLGLGPKHGDLQIEDGSLRVRFGWAFRTEIPLSAIKEAKPHTERVSHWGVHGWRGCWLVNGSSRGVVDLTIDPPVRAKVAGKSVKLRTLWVSVTDPDELIADVTRKA